jgi:hypothetical protein
VMGAPLLAAIGTFDVACGRQSVMRPAHVPPRWRSLSLWNRHGGATPLTAESTGLAPRALDRPVAGEIRARNKAERGCGFKCAGPRGPSLAVPLTALEHGEGALWGGGLLRKIKDHPGRAGIGIDRQREFFEERCSEVIAGVMDFLWPFIPRGG